jgi:outer membrane protein assembly factor BamB
MFPLGTRLASQLLALLAATGCAPRGTPAGHRAPLAPPAARPVPPSSTPPAPSLCAPLRAEQVLPSSPAPGLHVYDPEGCEASRVVSDHVACLQTRGASSLLLVPFAGGPARRILGDRVDFRRYVAPSHAPQSSLIVVAGSGGDESCARGVYAFDPGTLAPRWHYAPAFDWIDQARNPAETNGWVFGEDSAGLLALRFRTRLPRANEPAFSNLAVLDAATGAQRWLRRLPPFAFVAGLSQQVIVQAPLYGPGTLGAAMSGNGRDLWSLGLSERALAISVHDEHVALLVQRSPASRSEAPERCTSEPCVIDLWMVDARNGTTVSRAPIGAGQQANWALANAGDDVYAEAPAELNGFLAARVIAFDPRSGRERWRTRPFPCEDPWFETSHFQVMPSTLYACTCDGVLRAFDRGDGRVLSELGVGDCAPFFVSGDVAVASLASDFTRVEFANLAAPRRVTVRGRIQAELGLSLPLPRWVRVGPELVKTDQAGRFRVTFEGRGAYTANVAVAPAERYLIEVEPTNLTLNRRQTDYNVTLRARPFAE